MCHFDKNRILRHNTRLPTESWKLLNNSPGSIEKSGTNQRGGPMWRRLGESRSKPSRFRPIYEEIKTTRKCRLGNVKESKTIEDGSRGAGVTHAHRGRRWVALNPINRSMTHASSTNSTRHPSAPSEIRPTHHPPPNLRLSRRKGRQNDSAIS